MTLVFSSWFESEGLLGLGFWRRTGGRVKFLKFWRAICDKLFDEERNESSKSSWVLAFMELWKDPRRRIMLKVYWTFGMNEGRICDCQEIQVCYGVLTSCVLVVEYSLSMNLAARKGAIMEICWFFTCVLFWVEVFSAVSCLVMELAALRGPETGPVNWKVVVYKASFNAISIGHCSRAVQFLPDEDFCSRRGSYRDLSIVVTQRQGGSPLRAGMRKDLMRYTQSFKTTVTNWAHVLRAEFEFLWRLAWDLVSCSNRGWWRPVYLYKNGRVFLFLFVDSSPLARLLRYFLNLL